MICAARPGAAVGFGVTGPLAAKWFPRRKTIQLVELALECGVEAFDCGAFYGGGLGEERLGEALRGRGGEAKVFSKTGTRHDRFGRARKDFSASAIREDVENSLRRLRRERIDILYLHGPASDAVAPAFETLRILREEGKVGLIGVCTNPSHAMDAVEKGAEALMTPWSFLNAAAAPAIAEAKRRGVHVAAISPLAQGVYEPGFGQIGSASDFWRILRARVKNPELLAAAPRIAERLAAVTERRPLASAALAYVLGGSSIDVAVFTTTKRQRLRTLAGVVPASPSELDAMRQVGEEFAGLV